MAGRFQRLDNSEDIVNSPEINYQPTYYDEPQSTYQPYSQSGFNPDDRRRMSYTTRKPVPQYGASQAITPEQPLIDKFDKQPQVSVIEQRPQATKRKSNSSGLARTVATVWSKARGQHVSNVSTPLFAAPWRHEPSTDLNGSPSSTVRHFNRNKQQKRIFFHFFLQWLVTVFFCAALLTTVYLYSKEESITRRQKYMFNALVIGLSLCMGFAVVNGMKEYANILRWWLLSGRHHSLQQFEILLNISSQKKSLRLLWVGRTPGSILPNGIQLLCAGYLLLMLGLQIVIALLGLCYSVEAIDGGYTLTRGNVSIASLQKIEQFGSFRNDVDEFQLQSGAANAYGISGQRYGVYYTETDDKKPSTDFGLPLSTDNSTLWWYNFVDRCTDPTCSTWYTTYRWVSSTTTCKEYPVIAGGYSDSGRVNYTGDNGQRYFIPYFGSETSATTTYYSNTAKSCGDRCTSVYVLNTGYKSATTTEVWRPQLFFCTNTISEVANSEHLEDSDAYQLPDEQARLIAGSIGYNGVSFVELNNGYQAHTYDIGSFWSWTRLNGAPMKATDIANNIMHFSTATLAAIDYSGARTFVNGDTPIPAQHVEVLWKWALFASISVPLIQFMVLLLTVFWGNAAVIRDGSFLSTASLLRPIVDRLERTGCALTSDEICEVVGNPDVAYGVRMPQHSSSYGGMAKGNDEVMHLDVVEEEEVNNTAPGYGWRAGMVMPQGRYDGISKENTGVSTGRESTGLRKRRKSF